MSDGVAVDPVEVAWFDQWLAESADPDHPADARALKAWSSIKVRLASMALTASVSERLLARAPADPLAPRPTSMRERIAAEVFTDLAPAIVHDDTEALRQAARHAWSAAGAFTDAATALGFASGEAQSGTAMCPECRSHVAVDRGGFFVRHLQGQDQAGHRRECPGSGHQAWSRGDRAPGSDGVPSRICRECGQRVAVDPNGAAEVHTRNDLPGHDECSGSRLVPR